MAKHTKKPKGTIKMLDKIKRLIEKIKYYFSHEACYNDMEQQGIAVFGMCCGVTGGDRNSEYLSYQCMDCPYLTLSKRSELDAR